MPEGRGYLGGFVQLVLRAGRGARAAPVSLYGEERVLFGSDYPMWSVGDEIQNILSLNLPARVNEQIFSGNLSKLLNL